MSITPPPGTPVGPVEKGNDGKPLSYPASGSPVTISVAIATQNLPADATKPPPFDQPLPANFRPLLVAAEDVWEAAANVKFVNVADDPNNVADIRVGMSMLSKNPSTMNFIGYTNYSWNAQDQMQPDNTVRIDDPADIPVTALPNGDFRYNGYQTTVFQDMLHEIGHAIGLAHNPNDPTAIMNPILSAKNPFPDWQDVAGLQSLYGASTLAGFSPEESAVLLKLIPPSSTIS